MAAANLDTGNSNTGATSFTSGTYSLTSGALYLAFVGNNVASGTPLIPTAAGNGLTWNRENTLSFNNVARVTLFSASGSGEDGSLVFDFGTQTQSRAVWSIIEAPGVASAQQSAATFETGGTSLSGTLSAFAYNDNHTVGFIMKQPNEAVTPGDGFAEVVEDSTNPVYTVECEYKEAADTVFDWTWGSATTRSGGIGAELLLTANSSVTANTLDLTSKTW